MATQQQQQQQNFQPQLNYDQTRQYVSLYGKNPGAFRPEQSGNMLNIIMSLFMKESLVF